MAGDRSDGKTRRGGGFRRAAEAVPALVSPALRRRGFAQTDLVLRWPEIVGAALADACRPERLQWPRGEAAAGDGAVLHLTVAPGWATEVQHLEPLMLERVNRFFGWRAVMRLKLRQGSIVPARRPTGPRLRALEPEDAALLDRLVAGIDDVRLRATLRRLGTSIFTRDDDAAR